MKTRKMTISEWFNQEHVAGTICTLPFFIGFLLFMAIPMGLSLYYSLCDFDILSPPEFIGFANYIKAFTDDSKFYNVLLTTLKFAFISVPLRLIFALFIAMLLLRTTKLSAFYRGVYYLPSIIGGSVAVAILWKRMFAVNGSINAILGFLGLPSDTSWYGDTKYAIWTLIILAVWQFGSSMLIFLASLKQIPRTLYEAAEVDGANRFRQFFKITIPLLTPTIFFNLVMQMIHGFLAFTQCYIITQGKPLDSTLFYIVYMYQQSFEYYNTGYGAALAWIMLIIVGAMTGILFGTKKLWVYDGGL